MIETVSKSLRCLVAVTLGWLLFSVPTARAQAGGPTCGSGNQAPVVSCLPPTRWQADPATCGACPFAFPNPTDPSTCGQNPWSQVEMPNPIFTATDADGDDVTCYVDWTSDCACSPGGGYPMSGASTVAQAAQVHCMDACGNPSLDVACPMYVVDTTTPALSCPDYVVQCGGSIGATPSAPDTCWSVGTQCTLASGADLGSWTPSMGNTTYTCTAMVLNGAVGSPSTTCGGQITAVAPQPMGAPSNINSNFNGTPIAAGDTIWWNSVMKVQGLNGRRATLHFDHAQVSIGSGCMAGTQATPGATVTFDPAVKRASTSFDAAGNQWVTTLPESGLAGSVMLDAFAQPVSCAMAGGVNLASWSGRFWSDTPGLTICWQWAAANYKPSSLVDYNALQVKPVDDNKASAYLNSDHAATPEALKSLVTGGARGGGGSNYTGSYSGTVCVSSPVASATCP